MPECKSFIKVCNKKCVNSPFTAIATPDGETWKDGVVGEGANGGKGKEGRKTIL